jgi:hypothetical protein
MNTFVENSGRFFTGCNYWASHAGTAMWSEWKPEVIEGDFRRLHDAKIRVLRVFPLWPDFQPIHQLRGYLGRPMEIRFGEDPLPEGNTGGAGMSEVALERFASFAELASRYELQLVVALVTGWMSGRLFVPPAIEGRNVITDPFAIRWQVRFVQCFVSRFKDTAAVVAWELGNECNCMGPVSSADEAWTWTSILTNAIRAVDVSKPVLSGMHSLHPTGNWSIQDQAELTDCLTSHPYPYFTPHCDQDPINTIRTGLHAVAESLYYRGIGGKACFVEEIGTLGPMFTSDRTGADFIRNNLYTLWAHDCRGLLWWCANEQTNLTRAPYDWYSIERELGFFRLDGSPKPVVREVTKFTRFLESFPGGTLPPRIVDGICILTEGQDCWGTAYSTFILAKQAGLDIEFQYATQSIRPASLYLMPSMRGHACMSHRRLEELMREVFRGAALYLSFDNGLMSFFAQILGVTIVTREKRSSPDQVTVHSESGNTVLELSGSHRFQLEGGTAEVLAANQDGMPAFTCVSHGAGKVFFLNYALETSLLPKGGAFHGASAKPYWAVYRELKKAIATRKVVEKDHPNVGITEHPVDEHTRYVISINYEPHEVTVNLTIPPGWRVTEALNDHARSATGQSGCFSLTLPHNDAAVFAISQ